MRILFTVVFGLAAMGHSLPAYSGPAGDTVVPSPSKRPLRPADLYRLPAVSDQQLSPDGKWVAYTLTTIDSIKDKRTSAIWMISTDGSQDLRMTNSPEGESRPRWSPDGKYLSFLSSRHESKGSQVWLMDRRGGEGRRLTEIKGGVNDYAWSPDGQQLLLTLTDQEPEDTGKVKTTKPYVIDRYKYKEDVEGYQFKKLYTHLYLFTIDTKKTDTLTRGVHDEGAAVWSPDGATIAFVSNRTEDPDKNENTDLYTIAARPGSIPRQLTNWKGADNSPRWSPDGQYIAYTRSTSDADYIMYDQPVLALISKDGGEPKLLTRNLDRPVRNPRWSKDGKNIIAQVTDDRQQYLAAFSPVDGKMTKLADGPRSYGPADAISDDSWLTTLSEPQLPAELFVVENGKPRRLTHHMDEFLTPLSLATVEGFNSRSNDGTQVSGLLFRPATATPGQKLPLILFIHGGPVSQDDYGFDLTRQVLAAGGYAVAAVNYRGSNGRGLDFCKIISADWGNKEVIDLHGAVDYLVKQGIADPDKLGVGGWSYGGILTDYLIAADTRFKAATSGAGTGFTLSLYGVDRYVNQYNNEIGAPWKSIDKYLKISYPLLKADRIRTPTLFLSGEKDFNVPSAGSEQMYQALRTLGVTTELIIYPGQFHGITLPSYQKDRLERYLAWYGKYLK
ncbi:S9 family peptidase [Flavitalea sp. BT771]|uniref:S9 family peptidase n=1 Tax=Flavitalea sp. BT771 TaxID=3063329 RepID=UPI0026E2F86F|nr:S9 family peptidase [Flavitalea sp. BT771]MDO6429814.1 S9 family peptidase [Flavitalea sp. BT771]MDV6218058.1 S9 family peptidase [Flavitalea sp. BT771]